MIVSECITCSLSFAGVGCNRIFVSEADRFGGGYSRYVAAESQRVAAFNTCRLRAVESTVADCEGLVAVEYDIHCRSTAAQAGEGDIPVVFVEIAD